VRHYIPAHRQGQRRRCNLEEEHLAPQFLESHSKDPYKHKMGLDHHPANKTETQKNRFTYISERPDEANFLIQRQSFCIRKICCSLLCFSLQSVMNLTNPDHTSSERITFQFTFSNNRENSVVLIVCCNLLPHAIRTT
jgi:hypothetical protein